LKAKPRVESLLLELGNTIPILTLDETDQRIQTTYSFLWENDMKKTTRGEVSNLVRTLIAQKPDAGPTEIAKEAARHLGRKVQSSMVSTLKTQMKQKGLLNGKPMTAPPTIHAEATVAPKPTVAGRQTMTVVETVEIIRELIQQHGKNELSKLIEVL
jgi:hypothetical protein